MLQVGIGSPAPPPNDLRHTVCDESFAREYKPWRPVVAQVADKFLACGVLDHSVARIRSDACTHEYLLTSSCKCRFFYPSCLAKRLAIWTRWLDTTLLAVGVVACLQTLGSRANLHPHLHPVVTDGGFRPDGTFVSLPADDTARLTKAVRRAGRDAGVRSIPRSARTAGR